VPDAVRRAVDRTFQSTLGSAGSTRDRAQDLVDDVLRIAEQGAARAGRSVRGVREAGGRASRQAEAAAGVPERLRDAIGDLRVATREDVRALRAELEALSERVASLEARLTAIAAGPAPTSQPSTPGGTERPPGTGPTRPPER
jgi:polyhydroxyalkanoate synthesis regulator phasin